MKKIALAALLFTMISACKKADDSNCSKPQFSINVNNASITATVQGGNAGFVEAEYGPLGFGLGTGTKVTTTSVIQANNFQNGAYDMYVRRNCGGNNFSDYEGPKSFLIENGKQPNNCYIPYNLNPQESFSSSPTDYTFNLYWSISTPANYYEVAYGLQGFDPDAANHIFCNNNGYGSFSVEGNRVYDFYVRANCGPGIFSDWSAVKTYKPSRSYNYTVLTCDATNTFAWSMDAATKKVHMNWNENSEKAWDLVVNRVENSATGPDAVLTARPVAYETITTTGKPQTIYVFVRTKCTNGLTSAWHNDSIIIQ